MNFVSPPRIFRLRCVAALLALFAGAGLASFAADAPRIVVKPGDWGDAGVADIGKVLESTAREFCRPFPEAIDPIEVSRGKGSPQVLFRRGPNREYLVQLDVSGTFWAQFAFQFAHELGHIQCRYRDVRHPNLWFEEAICETASLFALRRMAESWKTKPPYPNWKSFAPKLDDYADKRLAEGRLAEGSTLAAWYEGHEIELRENHALRDLNLVAAAALLPHFEKSPENWEAVNWLNAAPTAKEQSLAEYLQGWQDRCPPRRRAFVRTLALELGVPLAEKIESD